MCTYIKTARAIENQCYVLAAAQFGQHNHKRESYGHSIAIDPWGETIADAGGADRIGDSQKEKGKKDDIIDVPSIILFEIDEQKMNSVRERMPLQQHRENFSFGW